MSFCLTTIIFFFQINNNYCIATNNIDENQKESISDFIKDSTTPITNESQSSTEANARSVEPPNISKDSEDELTVSDESLDIKGEVTYIEAKNGKITSEYHDLIGETLSDEELSKYKGNCTIEQLKEISDKCANDNLHQLISKFELLELSQNLFLNECETNQLYCFTHDLWIKNAKCVCDICDRHHWIFEPTEESYLKIFAANYELQECGGKFPERLEHVYFCDFMKSPDRQKPGKYCTNKIKTETQIEKEETKFDFDDSSTALGYNNKAIISLTMVIGFAMMISFYFVYR